MVISSGIEVFSFLNRDLEVFLSKQDAPKGERAIPVLSGNHFLVFACGVVYDSMTFFRRTNFRMRVFNQNKQTKPNQT